MMIPPGQLSDVQDLYDRGLFLQAHARATALGPYKDWRGPEGRVLAGRLCRVVGAPRLGNACHYFGGREHPGHPQVLYFYTLAAMAHRDPWRLWQFLRAHGDLASADADTHASWLALHAIVRAHIRDFSEAERWMERAERANPGLAWLQVEWAEIFEIEDRVDDALAACRRALELTPWFRPAIHSYAHLLTQQNRLDECCAFLEEAARHNEAASIFWQLGAIQVEQKRYHEALASYAAFEERSPARDRFVERQLGAMRCDVYCLLGDYEAAARAARLAKTKYYTRLAERIEDPATPRKSVSLPVGFVRQHHDTCAPATFTMLANYWKVEIDHLSLAQQVTYAGTPGFVERAWAEDHGWVMREFTVTWDAARALLDRGIPFTLHTTDVTSGHAQAVIGYDELRETFVIRDPNVRHFLEFAHERLLEKQKATGPHGMVLLPKEELARLDGLELPDLALHEQTYVLERALYRHDREAAWRAYEDMASHAPGHRLVHTARMLLAYYDDDRRARLDAFQAMRALFPDHPYYLQGTLDGLRDLARPAERLEMLAGLASKHPDPIFGLMYAEEIRHDAAQHARAKELIARSIRRRPSKGQGYQMLAALLWDQRAFDDATELYRFAACLDDKDERFIESYFSAARLQKKLDEANRFLRDRVARYGQQSSLPARTLFWSLEQQGLANQGFDVLDEGFKKRPEDGDLMLYSASVHARYGHFDRAEQFLRAAKGKTKHTYWLRVAAEFEGLRTDPAAALELWKQVVEASPLDLGAHRALAMCLAETQSRAAALEHLYALAARFPHHLGIYWLCLEWLREEPPEEAEPFLRHFLELDPHSTWARRELAWNLIAQRRLEEAAAEADVTRRMNPSDPEEYVLLGALHQNAGRMPEARAAYRQALSLSVEETRAFERLMQISYTPEECREALQFYYGELVRQVNQGDGLLVFWQHARGTLNKEELLEKLRQAHAARPDLWHTWAALSRQCLDMNRLEEAHAYSCAALERFPLLAHLWLDHASICRARKDSPNEMHALQAAYQIGARWGPAARHLSNAYARLQQWDKSKEILEAAAARDPLDPRNHSYLAEALYHLGEKSEALARLERAVFIEPNDDWAWSMLHEWSAELGEPHRAIEGARALAQRRPGDPNAWLVFAKSLDPEKQGDERMTALDQVLRLSPRHDEAHDLRAETLAALKRWDEALQACRPEVFGDKPPFPLRGRAAWIKAEAGRRADAIADMRALLKEAPEYAWGWEQLVRWYFHGEEEHPYLHAAQAFLRLSPNRANALGYLGDAWLRCKDRAGARAAFERAIELSPEYAFALGSLFDMQLEDQDHAGAECTLQQMSKEADDPLALSSTVRLRAATGYESDALEHLKILARVPAANRGYLDEALAALDRAGWARQASKALEDVATEPGAPALLGEVAVDRLAKRKRWADAAAVTAKLMDQGEAGLRAASSLMSAMANDDARAALLAFIDQHRHPLHKDTGTWGTAGYALTAVREYGRCVHWLSDWYKRPTVEPWILINLVLAHQYLGHEDEAIEAARSALKLQPDHTTPMHHVWCGIERAMAGDAAGAEAHLTQVNGEKLKPSNRFVLALAHIAMEIARGKLDAAAFQAQKLKLREAARLDATYLNDPMMGRLYAKVTRRIAAARGGVSGWFWYLSQWPSLPKH